MALACGLREEGPGNMHQSWSSADRRLPMVRLLKALWGGQHRRPSNFDRHTGADWRKKACNAKSATAGGRLRDEIYTTDRAGVAIFTYVCDVTSAAAEHVSTKS